MGHKIEAGYGIREILRTGYEICLRDRDLLVSICGMRDRLEIDSGMRDLKDPFWTLRKKRRLWEGNWFEIQKSYSSSTCSRTLCVKVTIFYSCATFKLPSLSTILCVITYFKQRLPYLPFN